MRHQPLHFISFMAACLGACTEPAVESFDGDASTETSPAASEEAARELVTITLSNGVRGVFAASPDGAITFEERANHQQNLANDELGDLAVYEAYALLVPREHGVPREILDIARSYGDEELFDGWHAVQHANNLKVATSYAPSLARLNAPVCGTASELADFVGWACGNTQGTTYCDSGKWTNNVRTANGNGSVATKTLGCNFWTMSITHSGYRPIFGDWDVAYFANLTDWWDTARWSKTTTVSADSTKRKAQVQLYDPDEVPVGYSTQAIPGYFRTRTSFF